jgi:hypothetical protein
MADISATTEKQPGAWDEEWKKFWDAFCDIYWGKGGNTAYHTMLLEDEEWLRNAYLQNNEALTQMEQQYVRSLSDTSRQFEQGMQQGTITMGGGNQQMSFVPGATQRSLESLKTNRNEVATARLAAGQDQANRIMDYAQNMPPNTANTAYLQNLANVAMTGQQTRHGLPTSTYTGEVPEETTQQKLSGYVDFGSGLLNFGNNLVNSSFWDKIDFGSLFGGGNTAATSNFSSFLDSGISNPWM